MRNLGGAGLEPVGLELAGVEQQQDVEGVVNLLVPPPGIAVVPAAYLFPVESGQFGGEHGVQVGFRVAADRGVARVQGDVLQVVETGEEAHLGELADAGEQREPDVRVAVLDDGVQAAQSVPVGLGHFRLLQRIEYRLVVFVHQHRHPSSGAFVQLGDQPAEAGGGAAVAGGEAGALLDGLELRRHVLAQPVRVPEVAAAEAQPHHGGGRPVPSVVDGEPPEQFLAALEQFLDGVQQQALAEAPGAGQEVLVSLVHQPSDPGGLVHVVAALFAELAEGLDADGQLAPGGAWGGKAHGDTITPCRGRVKVQGQGCGGAGPFLTRASCQSTVGNRFPCRSPDSCL